MSRTGGGKEVLSTAAVVVGVGVGVAAFAGLGLAAGAFGAGVLSATAFDNFAGRRAKPALQPADVRRDPAGRVEKWPQLLKAIQTGGAASELRAELWPLLLGVFPPSSTVQERQAELLNLRRLYIKLVLVCWELDTQLQVLRSSRGTAAPNGSTTPPTASAVEPESAANGGSGAVPSPQSAGGGEAPSSSTQSAPPLPGNLAAFAEAHRIIVMDAVRTDLRRGAQPAGRPHSAAGLPTILPVAVGDGLPELMFVGDERDAAAPSTGEELEAIAADPASAAARRRLPRWRSALAQDMVWGAAHLDEAQRCQMLRLINILSAYSVHDPETGYCQGMSDLASVFVQLFDDDALAFACFERLMRSTRRNFRHDETGIRHQLQQVARVLRDTDPSLYQRLRQLGAEDCMFAYRMVVVLLRRELPPLACCTLWEMQWAHEVAAQLDAEAPATPSSSSSNGSMQGLAGSRQQQSATAGGSKGAGPSQSGGGGRQLSYVAPGIAADATAVAGLQSTIQSLSEATTGARAAAQLAQRPGSSSGRHGGGRATLTEEEPPDFVLQFVAAVVRAHRGRIMNECREHDDVLRLFNSLSIEFWPAVAQARKQWRAYVSRGAAAPPL